MKYCMISPCLVAPGDDGAAASVARISAALARRGHEVHLLCNRAPEQGPPRFVVHPIRRSWWSAVGAIGRRIRAIRPEVIHVHDPALAGGRRFLELGSPGAIKLLTTQAVPPPGPAGSRHARACRALDGVICPEGAGSPETRPRGLGVGITHIPHLPADGDAWAEAEHLGRYLALVDACRRNRRVRFDHPREPSGPRPRGHGRRELRSARTPLPG